MLSFVASYQPHSGYGIPAQHTAQRMASEFADDAAWTLVLLPTPFHTSPERWIISSIAPANLKQDLTSRAELESRELPSPEANKIEADTESLARSTAPAPKDQSFAKEYDLHVRDSWDST
ncbi:unnamed protein product, partial [Fusarium graminearum]